MPLVLWGELNGDVGVVLFPSAGFCFVFFVFILITRCSSQVHSIPITCFPHPPHSPLVTIRVFSVLQSLSWFASLFPLVFCFVS